MSDLILIALISAGAPALVSVAGAVASIFGPAWQSARARRADEERAMREERYTRAREFIEALGKTGMLNYMKEVVEVHAARDRFVAVLRAGEGGIAEFASEARRRAWAAADDRAEVVSRVADSLYGYLRGDLKAEQLTPDRLDKPAPPTPPKGEI
jgi:hypothetical protein